MHKYAYIKYEINTEIKKCNSLCTLTFMMFKQQQVELNQYKTSSFFWNYYL